MARAPKRAKTERAKSKQTKTKQTKTKAVKKQRGGREAAPARAMAGRAAAAPTLPEPSAAAIAQARPIVLQALGFGNVADSKKLTALGFDTAALAGLAAKLRQLGVHINNAPVQACDTVLCVIKAVARVQG
jgi:hypothetical protein